MGSPPSQVVLCFHIGSSDLGPWEVLQEAKTAVAKSPKLHWKERLNGRGAAKLFAEITQAGFRLVKKQVEKRHKFVAHSCTSPHTMHENFAWPRSFHSKRWKPSVEANSAGARADDALRI